MFFDKEDTKLFSSQFQYSIYIKLPPFVRTIIAQEASDS